MPHASECHLEALNVTNCRVSLRNNKRTESYRSVSISLCSLKHTINFNLLSNSFNIHLSTKLLSFHLWYQHFRPFFRTLDLGQETPRAGWVLPSYLPNDFYGKTTLLRDQDPYVVQTCRVLSWLCQASNPTPLWSRHIMPLESPSQKKTLFFFLNFPSLVPNQVSVVSQIESQFLSMTCNDFHDPSTKILLIFPTCTFMYLHFIHQYLWTFLKSSDFR